MITPWWPLAGLAAIQLIDAALCVRPAAFIASCLDDVGFPRRYWSLLPPLKIAAALGLVIGIWVPVLALVTTVALVIYFVLAVAMHIRARDFGRNLFLNATGMLLLCVAELAYVVNKSVAGL